MRELSILYPLSCSVAACELVDTTRPPLVLPRAAMRLALLS